MFFWVSLRPEKHTNSKEKRPRALVHGVRPGQRQLEAVGVASGPLARCQDPGGRESARWVSDLGHGAVPRPETV